MEAQSDDFNIDYKSFQFSCNKTLIPNILSPVELYRSHIYARLARLHLSRTILPKNIEADALNEKMIGTILFVDDEPLSLKYFKASVGKYANVKTASSTDAALEILEADGEEITVVVSDERMPRESGVSFLSDVRKSWPSTVRVLTSAYADIDNLQHAINDAAIFRFIPKPWNLDELSAAIQDALQVERSTSALDKPLPVPATGGDAKDASLALLAILANGFDAPLRSLGTEAQELARLSAQGSLDTPQTASSYIESWASRLKNSKIGAASAQVQKDVEHCRSLASSIGRLVRDLLGPASNLTSSMADTLLEVIEQNTHGPAKALSLDTSRDFTYRMPREIMKFIVANLLRGSRSKARQALPEPFGEIALFTGAAHNEVQLTLGPGVSPAPLEDNQAWRTIRSALWAFGGELLVSIDGVSGRATVTLHLPKTA
jgi:two-component system, probable response regulator PhcQ